MSHIMSEGGHAVKLTPELESAIAQAPSAELIKRLIHQAEEAQGLIQKDPYDQRGDNYFAYTPVEQPIPQSLARTVIVNGTKHVLEVPIAAGEAGLQHAELELMRSLFNQPAASAPARDAAGRFLSAEDSSRAAEAQRELDAIAARDAAAATDPGAQAESEIVRRALEAQGISVAELKQYSDAQRERKYSATWQKAGEDFQKANPDWAGGDNYQVMLDLIQSSPSLLDNPSADTLGRVWAHMKANNLVVENQEDVEARELAAANTPDELAQVLRSRNRIAPLGTNLWGR